jgi:hypothetical protein
VSGVARLVLLLVVLAGVGLLANGKLGARLDDARDVADPVAFAAERSAGYGGARAISRVTITPQGGEPIVVLQGGTVDFARRRAELAYDMGELGKWVGGAIPGKDLTGKILVDGMKLYVRDPLLARLMGSKRKWFKIDEQRVWRRHGVDMKWLEQLASNNPVDALAVLRATGSVRDTGIEEAVRGVPARKYRARIDLRRYPRLAPRKDRARARRMIRRFIAATGRRTYRVSVWVDRHGLIRRETYSFRHRVGGRRVRYEFDTTWFDYGDVRVRLRKPSARRIVDITRYVRIARLSE